MPSSWLSGLCSCSGPCFSACCCPCILIGKNEARLSDPSNKNPSCCNATCMAFCGLEMVGHFGWILGMMQRGRVREKYRIEGGGCGDCCVSFWCPCCGLLQQANEIEEREGMLDKGGYVAQGGMRMG